MTDGRKLVMFIVAAMLIVAGLGVALLVWGPLYDHLVVGGDFWGLSEAAAKEYLRINVLTNVRDGALVAAGVGALIGVFALLIPSSTAK